MPTRPFEATLTGRELGQLHQIVLEAFRTERAFDEFLGSALNINPEARRGEDYSTTVSNQLGDFRAANRLREFVRKAHVAKRLNPRLRAFVESRLPNEGLVEILEQSSLDILAIFHQLPKAAPESLKTDPRVGEGHDSLLVVQRLGEIVDWLSEQQADESRPLVYPMFEFAARVLAAMPEDELAQRLRIWIRTAAQRRALAVPDIVLVHLAEDQSLTEDIEQVLRGARVVATRVERPAAAGWEFVLATARTHLARTTVVMSAATASQWSDLPADDRDPEMPAESMIRVIVEGDATPTLPAFLSKAVVLSWQSPTTDRERAAAVERLLVRTEREKRARADVVHISDVAPDIARAIRNDDLVFLVGPAAVARPTTYAMSRALLMRLNQGFADAQLVPPLDVVGTYCAINGGEKGLNEDMQEVLKELAGSPSDPNQLPEIYRTLALLLKEIPARRRPQRTSEHGNRRPLIVTTNRDLRLERMLLAEAVSFTRIVQHRSGERAPNEQTKRHLVVNEYQPNVRGNELRLNGWDGALDLTVPTFEKMDAAIFSCRRTLEDEKGLFVQGQEGQDRPIVYKYHGSYDNDGSWSIATAHYDALDSTAAPWIIRERLKTKPLLLLGYSCTDPEWRHVRRTLLHDLDDGIRDRYCVLYPFPVDEEETYFQVERALERRMPGEWRNAKIGCIMADGNAVLKEILGQLTRSR